MSDARVSAWIASWQRLSQARHAQDQLIKFLSKTKGDTDIGPHMENYRGLLNEARTYALLANVGDVTVGLAAGAVLDEYHRREERAEETRAAFEDLIQRRSTKDDTDVPD